MIDISLKFVPQGPFNNIPASGSDNGLAPSRRQAIIWTNDDYFTDAYMRHTVSMSYSRVSTTDRWPSLYEIDA